MEFLMSQSLTKMLQRRKLLAQKRVQIDHEIALLDGKIFPRVESMVAAFEGSENSSNDAPATPTKIVRARFRDHARPISTDEKQPSSPDLQQVAEKMQLAYQAKLVLEGSERPLNTTEILLLLKQRNIEVPGKNPQNNLAAHLSHHKRLFIRTPDGWQLRQGEIETRNTNALVQ